MKFTCEYNDILKSTVCKGQHESGLKVIVIKTPGFKKSYATFSTKYGSINTKFIVPGESSVTDVTDGIAHFLEHKVFEEPDGTNAFNDFSLYGANANAFTSFGVTNYLFSSTECFGENLKILLGFVQRPYFTEENVEKELVDSLALEVVFRVDENKVTSDDRIVENVVVINPNKNDDDKTHDQMMKLLKKYILITLI